MTIVAGLIGMLLAQAVTATPPPPPPLHGGPTEMTCPIGGEKFTALQTSSYSTMGERPDGRPYTYWVMPLPMPECPTNGLVLFRKFDAPQLAKLAALIGTSEYARMRREDTTYYRAQWLATRIGEPEPRALWMLLAATWQVKPARGEVGQPMTSAEKAAAYQREFVRRVRALPDRPGDKELHALWFRAANAERELGRFGEARAMLDRLDGWLAAGDPGGWRPAAAQLRGAIARRDASAEPLDIIGQEAVFICAEDEPRRSAFDRAYCARPEIASKAAEFRKMMGERRNR